MRCFLASHKIGGCVAPSPAALFVEITAGPKPCNLTRISARRCAAQLRVVRLNFCLNPGAADSDRAHQDAERSIVHKATRSVEAAHPLPVFVFHKRTSSSTL
jgi:hypothetical protein